jgi:hypothetical protein
VLIICSDGLSTMVRRADIADAVAAESGLERFCQRLVRPTARRTPQHHAGHRRPSDGTAPMLTLNPDITDPLTTDDRPARSYLAFP